MVSESFCDAHLRYMDSNRGNPMASRKRTLRLLWEIVFPYEIRWGIEEVANKASANDVKSLTRGNVQASTRARRFGTEPERPCRVAANPDLGDREISQRAS